MAQQAEDTNASPSEVTFHFTDSPFSRVILVDGIWGGITHNGGVHMAVFSQHHPIPESVTHEVDPSGMIGREKARAKVEGLVRTIEAHLILTKDTAVSIRDWLDDRIKLIEAGEQEKQEV